MATRREIVVGTLASVAAVAAPATKATAGQQHMRRLIAGRLEIARKCDAMEPGQFVDEVASALRTLAKFDRGEGCWYELARRHPAGIPPGAASLI